jgi:AraC-like DNA-binding protein
MQDIGISSSSFMKLFDYVESLGLDAESLARQVNIDYAEICLLPSDYQLSAKLYSKLYKAAVHEMQKVHPYVPWAAGLGSDAFEMMCYAIIGCETLGEAFDRAARFEAMLRPMSGRQLQVIREGDFVKLCYNIDTTNVASIFAPTSWQRSESYETVAVTSGLIVWHAFAGWLVGHSLQALRIDVARPSIGEAYSQSIENAISTQVFFNASQSCLHFDAEVLNYKVVQNDASLQQFLDMAVYQLSLVEKQPGSISEAIKQLMGQDFASGLPSFNEVAARLHLSESSLRRKLLKEHTTFQLIKDEVRCDLAKSYLSDSDMKINDVAERLGFTEPSSFVRSFRHWMGVTPKVYRESTNTRTVQRFAH